ncbi:hypothetical protein F4803DRAFT_547256 [Xylaria telfairii]|nr:hypothetical protein F4803DRAFT_547256 [Xylaria telfairii]
MKLSNAVVGLAALSHGVNAAAVLEAEVASLDTRRSQPDFEVHPERSTNEELWKRKGGGGGGGRGGGGSSGGGSSGGGTSGGGGSGTSGGGRGSGTGSSGSGSGSTGGRGGGIGSPSSNQGGRTTTGTGPPPRYGGGAYYGGGASAPYAAGQRSSSGIVPGLLAGAALGGIGFLGFSYLHGAWVYPYTHQYYYHNATTDMNETKPVICVCDPYNPCACDDNGNQTYFNSVIGDGSYNNLNHSLVTIAQNETTKQLTIYINGEEPNGTTAAGGTDAPDTSGSSDAPDSAGVSMMALAQAAGWWPAATMAFALAFIM